MDDPKEAIEGMENNLEVLAEAMQNPPSGDDRALVQDMLRHCQERRRHLEEMAHVVIDQDGGETVFNRIVAQLDRLEHLQDMFQSWSAGAGGHPASAGAPSLAGTSPRTEMPGSMGSGPTGAVGDEPVDARPHAQSASESGSRREKKKKDKKDKKKSADATAAEGGDAFNRAPTGASALDTPSAGDCAGGGASAFGAWPNSGDQGAAQSGASGGGSWGAGAGPAAWPSGAPKAEQQGGSFGGHDGTMSFASEWNPGGKTFPEVEGSGCSGGTAAANGASCANAGNAGSGWGSCSWADPPASTSAAACGAGFGKIGEEFRSGALASSQGTLGARGASQLATLHVRCPFSEIEHDIEGFTAQFVSAAAHAVGVAPHRIRVKNVRSG